jgi:hypothetical protein
MDEPEDYRFSIKMRCDFIYQKIKSDLALFPA